MQVKYDFKILLKEKDVVFNKRCGDCHGTGKRWRKIGLLGLVLPKVPCDKCYRASGVCLKCKGNGVDEKGNKRIIEVDFDKTLGQQCKYCLASIH